MLQPVCQSEGLLKAASKATEGCQVVLPKEVCRFLGGETSDSREVDSEQKGFHLGTCLVGALNCCEYRDLSRRNVKNLDDGVHVLREYLPQLCGLELLRMEILLLSSRSPEH